MLIGILIFLVLMCAQQMCWTLKVAVVGSGFGGWGAVKALVEGGIDEVVLLDSLPDPAGNQPYLTPTGKPFEPGHKGFWKDYPNIYSYVEKLKIDNIFSPCTNSSFYSPYGLEATAPVFGDSVELPSPLGQVFASAQLFERLPLSDRASMIGLLYAMIDFDRDEETFKKYDRMTAHELFLRFKLSKRLVDDFIRPTLLVGLFKPPEELSAAVTMELLYFYAMAHQTSFDVKWMKNKSIAQNLIAPLANSLAETYPALTIKGSSRVTEIITSKDAQSNSNKVDCLKYIDKSGSQVVMDDLDGVVLALGNKGMKAVVQNSPSLAHASPELSAAASLGGIDCIAVRLWLDKKVATRTPANVFSRFHQLRGAGGTFFMLDQLQDEAQLWGDDYRDGEKKGSVLACDFYNSGALMGLSNEDICHTLLNDQDGLLQQAVPEFKGAKILDSFVQRAPGAVSWFSPGSYVKRPPLIVPNFNNRLVTAGDWVKMGDKETRAKGLCQERAFITGLEAANTLLDALPVPFDVKKKAQVIPIREDEPQVILGREVNKKIMGMLKPFKLDSPWVI
jgi:uncharacterized protein with NAD-binding domain and iron-sulfur cluster